LKRILLAAVPILLSSLLLAQSPGKQVALPTTKRLTTPTPGHLGYLNSFAAAIALSPDGHYAALLNDGYGSQESQAHQSISVVDLQNNHLEDFPDQRLGEDAHQSYFLGLSFSGDGQHLYASVGSLTDPTGDRPGDTGNGIAVYAFHDGNVTPERFVKIPPQKIAAGKHAAIGLSNVPAGVAIPYPAGMALIPGTGHLLIADNLSDNVIVLDPASGHVLEQFDLSTSAMVPSSFPYTVAVARDGRRAYCSLWNASQVAELDLAGGTIRRWIPLLKPADPVAPGSHPTALALSPDEKFLYVALANVDKVAVVSTASGKAVNFLDTTAPGQKYAGTYPNALALSADGQRLFVAGASINAVAVFDPTMLPDGSPKSGSTAMGFIPTEWYPSALAVTGNDLLIASAKGKGTGPNNGLGMLQSERRHREHPYIPTLLRASVARLNIPDAEKNLANLTSQVEQDNLFRSDPGKIEFRNGKNPIKHVIYILKENRTYDQIFGDLKAGNGDLSLTMFGEDITPNEHKLALQFGVLDNFYDSGEVSGDGHIWSSAAITSDYNEKTWQIAYRSRERTYDFGGTVADEITMDHGVADVDDPGTGFLWDNLARHGLSYRDYGEFIGVTWCRTEKDTGSKQGTPSPFSERCPHAEVNQGETLAANVGQPHGSASPWPWSVPLMKGAKADKPVLRGHFDPNYPDFNTDYPDQLRADEFLNEFEEFVHARKERMEGELPAFILLYLPDDHTGGTRPGKPRPAASVADNDLAVGRVVEAVSHSPYWDDTAIFVIEDDAQAGADHVDAHRSTALVISKHSQGSAEKPFVDSRFYTTVNMIHTMEALLGLPPMNQNDAYAPVMAPLFAGSGNQPAFSADWRNRDNGLIYQINPEEAQGAEESERMDFSRPDAVNTQVLNAILWRDRKGDAPMPQPKHTVLP